jgi:hypothetical protein
VTYTIPLADEHTPQHGKPLPTPDIVMVQIPITAPVSQAPQFPTVQDLANTAPTFTKPLRTIVPTLRRL